jgi:uncharacterized protein YbbK (DUF523 family)
VGLCRGLAFFLEYVTLNTLEEVNTYPMKETKKPVLVSACLVGLCTRYDAQAKPCAELLEKLENSSWIPVCPEQLGGLSTPREAADIEGGDGRDVLAGYARVVTKSGRDLTAEFIHGAKQVLKIAQLQKSRSACLKGRSPSCAVHGKIGVTTALLEEHNIRVYEF